MTIENSIKRLNAYKKQSENPVNDTGMALTGDERKNAQEQSKANYEMMKKHILNSKKFKDHPIINELSEKPKEEITKSKEKK